ncbi:MAG: hypothetical protein AAGM16_03115 [Pseudomonadota bacterium]
MGASFYVLAAVMLLAGFLLAGWPLLRERRLGIAALVALALVGGGAALYPIASNYQPLSANYLALLDAQDEAGVRRAAAALSQELMSRPDDFQGWRLLGRARLEINEYAEAESALRQALRVAPGPDPELLLLLGQAISFGGTNRISPEAASLFIQAYQMAPNVPGAMWYAGLAHASRGENLAAAAAWEALLAQSPPPEVASILREQIAVLRATAQPASADASALTLAVRLGDTPQAAWPAAARLFVSVRDADRPGPPLAAAQYAPDVLPVTVALGDADAMIAGRNISSATRYEIVARVSMNGDPIGGSGDWVGRLSIDRAEVDGPIELVIDTVAP